MFDLIRRAVGGLFGWLDSMVPAVPSQVDQHCATIGGAIRNAGEYSWMAPFWALAWSVGILFTCLLAAITIRLFRSALSLATGGGGA